MSSNFSNISFLLFGFLILQVFCLNPITNIEVLDTYFTDAAKFLHNQPIFDGITLVLPKQPVQFPQNHPFNNLQHNQAHLTHHPHHVHSHIHSHHGRNPQLFHPREPHLDAVSISKSPHSSSFRFLTNDGRARYQPIFQSFIVPKTVGKYRKPKKNRVRPKYNPKKYNNKRKHKNRSKYPKSINDRLREKDYESDGEVDQQSKEEEEEEDNEKDEENEHFDDPYYQELENPKSFYNSLPPFGKEDKERQKTYSSVNRTKNMKNTENYSNNYNKIPETVTKYSEQPKYSLSDLSQSNGMSNSKKSESLFDNSPPFTTPNQLDFLKPIIQKNKEETHPSDPQNMVSNDYLGKNEKKYRTATANQMFIKQKEKEFNKNGVNNKERVITTKSIPTEDLRSNDDPNHYPHQYAIEIRWKNKDSEHYNLDAPEGDVGDREMHSSKDLDHARHRKYKHEEEEHWHQKKWLDEGLRQAYANGKPIPVQIVKPSIKLEGTPDFSPMPLYAQPMPTGATLDQINQHFAIPTPNFRVNTRFMDWTKSGIDLNNLQNLQNSYITLYG